MNHYSALHDRTGLKITFRHGLLEAPHQLFSEDPVKVDATRVGFGSVRVEN
jgi:hypothetical protein